MFLAYTGVRFGELSGLRVLRLDLLRRRSEIVEAVAEVGGAAIFSFAEVSPGPQQPAAHRGVLAITSGADVKVVQQMLGHASATTTLDLDGHLYGDRLDEVADRTDALRTARTCCGLFAGPKPS